ncbi:hypothetical protein [Vibrio coralliilyticus]|nr:hypothetical protein [Vibrio coralliilyticus]
MDASIFVFASLAFTCSSQSKFEVVARSAFVAVVAIGLARVGVFA